MENKERKHPVLCSWCEKEGQVNIVNWSTIPGSHSICPRHTKDLWKQTRERRRILDELEAASA